MAGRNIVERGKVMEKMRHIKKVVANAAYSSAVRSANRNCTYFFYQSKLPEKVKKLRKF